MTARGYTCGNCLTGKEEIAALRALAIWVRTNAKARSKPSKEVIRLLNQVADAQGEPRPFP